MLSPKRKIAPTTASTLIVSTKNEEEPYNKRTDADMQY